MIQSKIVHACNSCKEMQVKLTCVSCPVFLFSTPPAWGLSTWPTAHRSWTNPQRSRPRLASLSLATHAYKHTRAYILTHTCQTHARKLMHANLYTRVQTRSPSHTRKLIYTNTQFKLVHRHTYTHTHTRTQTHTHTNNAWNRSFTCLRGTLHLVVRCLFNSHCWFIIHTFFQ